MPFNFIQNAQALVSAVTTNPITVSAVGLNNLVVVNVKITSITANPTVTDNAPIPNTYLLGPSQTTSGNGNGIWQFYAVAVSPGATIITINWTGSASARCGVNEFSGNAFTNAQVFDDSSTGFSGSSAATTVTAFPPSMPGRLIVAGVDINSAVTSLVAGAKYKLANLGNTSLLEEYRLSGSLSETAPSSWTTASGWEEVAGAYVPSSAYNQLHVIRPYPFSPGLAR